MGDGRKNLHGFMGNNICRVIVEGVFCSRFVVKMS